MENEMKVNTVIAMAGLLFVSAGSCSEKKLSTDNLSPKRVSPDTVMWFDTQIAGFTYGIPGNVSQPQGALVQNEVERERYFTEVKKEFARINDLSLDTDQSRLFEQGNGSSYLLLQNNRCAGGILWAYLVPPTPRSSSMRKHVR